MLNVALTGNIASGKSTVAELFRRWGATVIDADRLVREAQAPGSPVLAAIAARFGPGSHRPDGDARPARAPPARHGGPGRARGLNRMVHPDVLRRRPASWRPRRAARGDRIVVSDIPAAVRGGRPDRVRRGRAGGRARDGPAGAAPGPARARRRRTPTACSRRRRRPAPSATRSTYVIDNDADRAALGARAREVWTQLVARAVPARA